MWLSVSLMKVFFLDGLHRDLWIWETIPWAKQLVWAFHFQSEAHQCLGRLARWEVEGFAPAITRKVLSFWSNQPVWRIPGLLCPGCGYWSWLWICLFETDSRIPLLGEQLSELAALFFCYVLMWPKQQKCEWGFLFCFAVFCFGFGFLVFVCFQARKSMQAKSRRKKANTFMMNG